MRTLIAIILLSITLTGYSQTKRTPVFNMLFGAYIMNEYTELETGKKSYVLFIKSQAYTEINEIFEGLRTSSLEEMKASLILWKEFSDKGVGVSQDFGKIRLTNTKQGTRVSATGRNDHYGYVAPKLIDKMIKKMDKFRDS